MKLQSRKQKAESRKLNASPGDAFTHYATRTTDHRRHVRHPSFSLRAFTLVEMLVVISVMILLASMIFPITRVIKQNQIRTRARGELFQTETAIEAYKTKLGYYPPDNAAVNPANYVVNQLYYELLGTTNIKVGNVPYYQTLDGSAQISADPAVLNSVFGLSVSGFMNCLRSAGGGDEGPSGTAFLRGLRANQFLAITNGVLNTPPVCTVLGSAVDGPLMLQNTNLDKLNPWRYNSSNPRYNAKSFDLWIDVKVGDKTNRICNWSDQPLVVAAPY